MRFFNYIRTWQKLSTKRLTKKNLKQLTENLDVEIGQSFTTDELEKLAKETKFVQREGKITGSIFLELIVFNSENLKQQSLNDISGTLKDEYNIEITKQSLHQRFNENAVSFLATALEKLLSDQLNNYVI